MAGGCLVSCAAVGAPLDLANSPLFIGGDESALVQLVLERDNKLFFEAYPSYEDVDGDGSPDLGYRPDSIDYAGYFSGSFCYESVADTHLKAIGTTSDKTCTDSWSGDYLNFLTMTRMDMLRHALYGGKRVVDTDDVTRLRRAFVPIDFHTWGIDYTSPEVDGYDISDYSPLAQPAAGKRHLLATNNVEMDDVPYLRVRLDSTQRIYDWVETEGPQGDGFANEQIALDVEVCATGFLEENCRLYADGGYKPAGILQEYSDDDAMYFSLLTGSYENNLRGGVLRETMRSFNTSEVDPATGRFIGTGGIVHSIDAIRIRNGFSGSTMHDCGRLKTRALMNGECSAWGNPVAEMMFEGLRYFAGMKAPTDAFATTGGIDEELGLESPAWDDPYATSQPYPQCLGAHQLVISDPNPSYDGDELPGNAFAPFTDSALGTLHVGDLADTVHLHEFGGPSSSFVGESGPDQDRVASLKSVTSFRDIRGHAPEEPHRQGSYYASSVSYYGSRNDLHPTAPGVQNVKNMTLALGSPVPTIDVRVAGRLVRFAPFGRTVGNHDHPGVPEGYARNNAIVGFTIESLTPTSGSYRVSFEDEEQGADNDMDALARYSYEVVGNTVQMTVDSFYATGNLIQHLGYGVAGTSNDGVHLVVRDRDTAPDKDLDYELDVPPGTRPGGLYDDGVELPLVSTVTFTPSAASDVSSLESPLWYAAKWGGFKDANGDGLPQRAEWDVDLDGTPDNYFPVSNPANLTATLRKAFDLIEAQSATAASVSVTGGALTTGDRVYTTDFVSADWVGQLRSFPIDADGTVGETEDWNANDALSGQITADTRRIITYNPVQEKGVPFRWPANPLAPSNDELDALQVAVLNSDPSTGAPDELGADRLSWLRGNPVEGMRSRLQPLGDIVNASPVVVGPPAAFYPDDWGVGAAESADPYSTFGRANSTRQRVVYAGANDGMLHAFDAGSHSDGVWSSGNGRELFAYVPNVVVPQLPRLTSEQYRHRYYVDATPRVGDAHLGDLKWRTVLTGGLRQGGQGVYALDITQPDGISEAVAEDVVLWEFTDADDADLGFTYSSPLIVRMHNGKWAAVFGNGYNSTAADAHVSQLGRSVLFVVDLATGELIRKFVSGRGSPDVPNGMSEPTAIDLDQDNVVDLIYAGDLQGNVWSFDVRASSPAQWKITGGKERFAALLPSDAAGPITAPLAVGSHPTGEGVMVYAGTGKFLEQSDLNPSAEVHRVFGLWDKTPFSTSSITHALRDGSLLRQRVTDERTRDVDTDGDNVSDTSFRVRRTSTNAIDWTAHTGWYIDLTHDNSSGEQVVSAPLLREGRVILNSLIATGDPCDPNQDGWFMVFDAANGGMGDASPLDLNDDGSFNEGTLTGVKGVGNPFTAPAIVAAGREDVIIYQTPTDPELGTVGLDAILRDGRLSWRELEP